MSEKSIVIVGAGIAGLSAGCYARMNGYKTTLFEMHNLPGGLCAAWKRKGYTFDISMHMLAGSKSGPLHRMWQELRVIQGRQFVYHDEWARIESRGKSLIICADPHRLEQQMLALSPADSGPTKEFIRLISRRGLRGTTPLKPTELAGPVDSLKRMVTILPHLGTLRRYGRLTIQEFSQRFHDPFLQNAVRFLIDQPGWPMLKFPMAGLTGFLKFATSEVGVPIGGSHGVILQMAEHYRQLGGEIHLKCRVKDVIVEKDRAVGVRLEDGTEQPADTVVWAADGRTVIFDMLGGRYLNDEIQRMYSEWTLVSPLVHVAIGVARDMSKEPCRLIYELEKPISIAGEERRWLSVRHRSFDPSMAPPGKSSIEVWYPARYDYWESLYQDRDRYLDEKKRIADLTISELDKHWLGFASQVEVVDVPTPMTYVRYTGNWKGSPDGWYPTVDVMDNLIKGSMLRSLPGLSGFAMVGQWTAPFTGTSGAALSGRQVIQLLCKQDGRPFVTSMQ
jgi:phytoene dehydrogenase-like protein